VRSAARAGLAALLLSATACGDGDGRTDAPQDDATTETLDTGVPIAPPSAPPSGGEPTADASRRAEDAALERDAGLGDGAPPPPPPPATEPTPPSEAPPPTPAGDAPGNAGWIGGSCPSDEACDYAEAFCLSPAEGWPNGTCSLDCDRFCPDRDGASTTFCVADIVAGGACVQQCDFAAYPATGCRPGYGCRPRGRFAEPDVRREVCTPGEAAPTPDLACDGELAQLGLSYIAAENPMEHPAGRPDLTCDVEGAIRLSSPVRGVTYASSFSGAASPMFMRCELAVALAALADYLSELDIVRVAHMGTYNCRTIAGSDSLSMHGLGLAIDIAGFVDAQGVEYSVLNDWEDGVDSPVTDKGRLLYEVAHQMLERGVFNIVLTPEFNAAHDNHFHVDLTPGADFIGFGPSPLPVVGTNPSGE
jgi:hypothetical protein